MPTSKELIEMANTEWKNRMERKGLHDRSSWVSGWISGYLTRNPQVLEKVLDELETFIGNLQFKYGLLSNQYLNSIKDKIEELREGKGGE